MKKRTLLLLAGLLTQIPSSGQTGNKNKASDLPKTVEECLDLYYYDEAEALLTRNIATLKRKRQSTERAEMQLEQIEQGRKMLEATEKVCFIDSFVVDKKQMLQTIRVSSESGRIDSYTRFFNRPDSMGCTVYISELENKIYFSEVDKQGRLNLYTSDRIGDTWTAPAPLQGLNEHDESQNFPFMLSDGITLYYAAEGEESLGGYDIFVSRYDTDSKSFLRPENIGMPFNSPANDYLFAWDEYNHLGWFVTDRNQPEDKVCVYVFIPNETRELYPLGSTAPDKLRRMARLHSIQETWTDKKAVDEARIRLSAALNQKQETVKPKEFEIVINNKLTYTSVADFQCPDARLMAQKWKADVADLKEASTQLNRLRETYTKGNATQKKQLERQILTMEQNCENMLSALKTQEKNIRNTEIKFLRK